MYKQDQQVTTSKFPITSITTLTRTVIADWYDHGVAQKYKFLFVVIDTVSKDFYPVFLGDMRDILTTRRHLSRDERTKCSLMFQLGNVEYNKSFS